MPEIVTVKVIFDEPVRAVTPGQAIVFYIDDYVLRWRQNNIRNSSIEDSKEYFLVTEE